MNPLQTQFSLIMCYSNESKVIVQEPEHQPCKVTQTVYTVNRENSKPSTNEMGMEGLGLLHYSPPCTQMKQTSRRRKHVTVAGKRSSIDVRMKRMEAQIIRNQHDIDSLKDEIVWMKQQLSFHNFEFKGKNHAALALWIRINYPSHAPS